MIRFVLILFSFLSLTDVNGQNNPGYQIEGKWKLCMHESLDSSFLCKTPFTQYIFQKDGTFTSDQEVMTNGKKYPVQGTWKIESTTLHLSVGNIPGYSSSPKRYFNLTVLNPRLFYSSGQSIAEDSARTYYTYFQKTD